MRKERIDNPRYPHHIRIVRRKETDWLDADGAETLEAAAGDGEAVYETDEIVVYEGPGRSYTDTTTTGDKKVDTNKRKASIPVRFDEWPVAMEQEQTGRLVPMSGDILYVTKGHITEEWEVKDFEPDNNRSVVYGEMNRNLDMGVAMI
ncbi:MAG: hypothetical protein IJ588_12540 [Prevotella sp.]|nr:hypothetical protein [Prevotella sp.]